MPALNFTEISQANKTNGEQDKFELFARDVLECLGFRIVEGPGRGADLGKDLVVEEARFGVMGESVIRWLVSCKHFAFSGRAVSPDDERNIRERADAHKCQGFMGFYSTLPTSALTELCRRLPLEVTFMDSELIEGRLLKAACGDFIIRRFFPKSHSAMRQKPALIFAEPSKICCDYCGKSLLDPPSGIWALWRAGWIDSTIKGNHYVEMQFTCKGDCDRRISARIKAKYASQGFVYDGWDDIPDFCVPTVFINKIMALMNGFATGNTYTSEAFDRTKQLILAVFPHVSRHLSHEDTEKIDSLRRIPSFLGGLGES